MTWSATRWLRYCKHLPRSRDSSTHRTQSVLPQPAPRRVLPWDPLHDDESRQGVRLSLPLTHPRRSALPRAYARRAQAGLEGIPPQGRYRRPRHVRGAPRRRTCRTTRQRAADQERGAHGELASGEQEGAAELQAYDGYPGYDGRVHRGGKGDREDVR